MQRRRSENSTGKGIDANNQMATAPDALQRQLGAIVEQSGALAEELKVANKELSTLNDELSARVERQTVELSEMSQLRQELQRQLVSAQEEERGRISRDLHDDTGQQVAALLLGLAHLKNLAALAQSPDAQALLAQMTEMASEVAQKSHRAAFTLRPTKLNGTGLLGALADYAETWSHWSKIPVEIESAGLKDADGKQVRLPTEIEITIYRVTQEALNNVLKHATGQGGATRVSILVQWHHQEVQAIIEDNGPGFDVMAAQTPPPGLGRLGLVGMQERARLAGGTLEIESAPGSGTTLFLRLSVAVE